MKALAWILLALVFSAPAAAETVNGQVVHGLSALPQAGGEVAFLVRQDGQLSEILRKRVDEAGRFSFSGPFISPGLRFFLVAFHGGLPYPSAELEVGAQRGVILEVFEPTADPAALHMGTHSLFFSLGKNGLEVLQVAQIHNGGQQTYAGTLVEGTRRATEFVLPEGAFNLQNFSGTFSQQGPDRFFDDRPLPPGDTQVAFSYFVNPERLSGDYVHQTVYPTQTLEVLVQPASIELDPPFADMGPVDFPNGQFRRYRLENLGAGDRVDIPLPLRRSLRWSFKWIALGMALLGVLALFWVRPAGAPVAGPAAEEEYRRLLAEVARLDDDYAATPEDPDYTQRRQRLMERLLERGRRIAADPAADAD